MTIRKKVQPPRIVEARLDHLPPEANPFERDMLKWMLRRGKYPNCPVEVKRVMEAEVNVEGDVSVTAREANVLSHEYHQNSTSFAKIDLSAILSVENKDNSYEFLSQMKPPLDHRPLPTLEELKTSFATNRYFLTDEDVFTIHQSIMLGRALLISGPPGVGKTEAAKQIALAMGLNVQDQNQYSELFCTPDIGTEQAIYQWNDAKRLLDLQLLNGVVAAFGGRLQNEHLLGMYKQVAENSYSLRYLEIRKLLRACIIPFRTVTLIDEADKPYTTFDNELLNIVGAYRCEIPEYGTLGKKLDHPQTDSRNPFFVLTINDSSSGGRDLSPMLVSRCTPLFLNYLPAKLEQKVIQSKCGMDEDSASRVAQFFYQIRVMSGMKLRNPPSTREVIATAQSLVMSKLQPTEHNLLRLNCHWIKNRLDYEALRAKYVAKDGNTETWKNSIS